LREPWKSFLTEKLPSRPLLMCKPRVKRSMQRYASLVRTSCDLRTSASIFTEPMRRHHHSFVSAPNLPQWSVCSKHFGFSGGPLELGLQRVINDVAIGSLLVQSDAKTGEPLLFQAKLPACIRERRRAENTWVFLLDAQARFAPCPRFSWLP
jgi:hypothetical protein